MLKALDDGGRFGATLSERQVSERATPVRSQRVKAAVALFLICLPPARAAAQEPRVVDRRIATVRAELERRYAENAAAFMRWDVKGVMALRAPGFHTVTPDGVTNDRAAMERYTEGLLHGIRKWNTLTQTIDSLRVAGDTAVVIMSQHLDRMALRPDNQGHQVETWATQRETWIRIGSAWFLWRVDQVRDQRRLVDGRPA